MFCCTLKIEGITDKEINETFSQCIVLFEKQGLDKNNILFTQGGKVNISGSGYDKRCAFCEYFRQALVKHFLNNEAKGTIVLTNCPFNKDKRLNYTPEVKKAREDFIKMWQDAENKK